MSDRLFVYKVTIGYDVQKTGLTKVNNNKKKVIHKHLQPKFNQQAASIWEPSQKFNILQKHILV
jgi:hypothetical protein